MPSSSHPLNRKNPSHITINTTPTPTIRIKYVGKGKVIFWKLFPWGLKNFQDNIIQSIIQHSLRAGKSILETKRNLYDTSLPAATHSVKPIDKRPIQECIHDITQIIYEFIPSVSRETWGEGQLLILLLSLL